MSGCYLDFENETELFLHIPTDYPFGIAMNDTYYVETENNLIQFMPTVTNPEIRELYLTQSDIDYLKIVYMVF